MERWDPGTAPLGPISRARSARVRLHCATWWTLAAACCWVSPVQADEKPLWEFGLGVGAVGFNDYRGSATAHGYPLPLPIIYYRGEYLKSDRDGVRDTLLKQSWLEINLSGNLTTPVRNDRIREGMPQLRSTLEAGPSLDFHLFKSNDARFKFDLRLPVRAATTVDSSPQYLGWTFTPRFNLDIADPLGYAGWNLGMALGPLFADRRYNTYFYSVDPQYATLSRPEYQAGGGYSGTTTLAALSKRFPRFWVGAYVRHDFLAGAAFVNSPLVQRNSYWSGGLGFAWVLRQSTTLVHVAD
jgi:outer membrane scaffolding protein for murein synthesis (MipA/OmpV family)